MKSARLLFFPACQAAAFAAACALQPSLPWAAAALIAAGALALCLSVHISFHEAVHQKLWPAAEGFMTLCMGLPFQGYRLHHLNHHRHNNGLEDYSTTWQTVDGEPRPQKAWAYAALWPRQLLRAMKDVRARAAAGDIPPAVQKSLARQKRLLAAAVAALFLFSWQAGLLYLALVYLGWALISLHNYGQHLPVDYGREKGLSYYAPLYNALLCRNGLHAEHHAAPDLPWHRLTPGQGFREVPLPHLAVPLLGDR